MNNKQKFLAVALTGAIIALALLIQAVCKFGFIVLAPFIIGHFSGLIANYLKHEWRAYNAKQARHSKTAYSSDGTASGQGKRPQKATCKALLQVFAQEMEG